MVVIILAVLHSLLLFHGVCLWACGPPVTITVNGFDGSLMDRWVPCIASDNSTRLSFYHRRFGGRVHRMGPGIKAPPHDTLSFYLFVA